MRNFLLFLLLVSVSALSAEPVNEKRASSSSTSSCHYLATLFDSSINTPTFLASFPTVDEGPLHHSAFLYDNAVAAIALIACGETNKARRIGDAILVAQANDRFWHDNRLRNAYAAGEVNDKPVKLPGWWDKTKNQWLEDRYQVGSDIGNMAWAMLALLALDNASHDQKYRDAALKLANWILIWHDNRGGGGFKGGSFAHEPDPILLSWKSTEHNTDLTAAFNLLAKVNGDRKWQDYAEETNRFVMSMWNSEKQSFATGVGDDGVTINPILALDAQVWPLLAIPQFSKKYVGIISTAKNHINFEEGFAYSEAKEGVWTEGTAQMLLLYELLGRNSDAGILRSVIAKQKSEEGGYFATSISTLPTSFMLATDPTKPRLYYHLPHLGAAAWVALAEQKFNPFTTTHSLP